MITDLLAGRRRVGTITTLVAPANAGALAIMTVSAGGGLVGTKTFVIRRLKIRNNGTGADTWVHIGTGLAGAVVDLLVPLRSINNTTLDLMEGDLPGVETNLTLMAYADALAAGNIMVQVEVEERG